MREIKFRAWDSAIQKYHQDVEDLGYALSDSELTVEQFTGLKDRTGQEIYEGDILSIQNNIWSSDDPSPGIRVVKWNENAPEFSAAYLDGNCRISGYSFVPANTIQFFEVIGNIHENPELLAGGHQ